jgi:hypothetical protein
VKTNHYDDIQKTLTGTSNANGSYTFTVRQIRQPLSITVAYPDVSNDAVASSDRIRSHNGRVYITPAQSGTIRIYNVTGIETFHATALRGETISTILPRGIYIVAVGGKTQKVVVR